MLTRRPLNSYELKRSNDFGMFLLVIIVIGVIVIGVCAQCGWS